MLRSRDSIIIAAALLVFSGCSSDGKQEPTLLTTEFLTALESENNISYQETRNSRASYITSMCYTKTKDDVTGEVFNPCYSCHTKGRIPNYYNDTTLQREYNFPQEAHKNPFSNIFIDKSDRIKAIDDTAILQYVRSNNYLDENGNILLAACLPVDWKGYRPDCYYNFDKDGFDWNPAGQMTGWRAFRYTPFLGTFWPTNGSTDDVLIRLAPEFYQTEDGVVDLEIYKLNLTIVEAIVKQKQIALPALIDEQIYGIDLDADGKIGEAEYVSPEVKSYVGLAKQKLSQSQLHLAKGLFPEGTEFLHSVRYIDWNEQDNHADIAARMKELRYAKKYAWSTYSEIERVAQSELWEMNSLDSTEAQLSVFRGNFENGLDNEISWVYQGFIEDKHGSLRPQTREETINCMGCHSHLGATTDSVFAFPRKLEGTNPEDAQYGWGHWSQKGLVGVQEPKAKYKDFGEQYEYAFYLMNNHSGNEFRDNNEVIEKFFDEQRQPKPEMFEALKKDISVLLLPSKQRAISLNKAYKTIVEDQSYIYGRGAVLSTPDNVYEYRSPEDITGIEQPIVAE